MLQRERGTYRDDHSTTRLQLSQERRRDVVGRRGDDDRIEGCRILPAIITITLSDCDIGIAEPLQPIGRAGGETRNDLDRVNLAHQTREYRRLVAGARADLEHDVLRPDLEKVGHQRDDEWLRNGLAVSDRQRPVGIRVLPHAIRHELVARHGAHDPQHLRRDTGAAEREGRITRIRFDGAHHPRALGGIIGGRGL